MMPTRPWLMRSMVMRKRRAGERDSSMRKFTSCASLPPPMTMAGESEAPSRLGSKRISRVLVAGSRGRSVASCRRAAMRRVFSALPLATIARAIPSSSVAEHPEQDLQLLPEGLRGLRPGLRLAAGLEQTQRCIHALRDPQLIEQLGILAAEALEIRCAFNGQATGEIALNDLVAGDEVAVHQLRGAWRGWRRCGRCGGRCCSRHYGGSGRTGRVRGGS